MGKIKPFQEVINKLKTTFTPFELWLWDNWEDIDKTLRKIYNQDKQKQQKMTKSKTSSRNKKVSKVKIETTPSGSYRVRKSSHGVVVNRTFKKKKDAVTFRDAFYA